MEISVFALRLIETGIENLVDEPAGQDEQAIWFRCDRQQQTATLWSHCLGRNFESPRFQGAEGRDSSGKALGFPVVSRNTQL